MTWQENPPTKYTATTGNGVFGAIKAKKSMSK
jgi:hypothetical protein